MKKYINYLIVLILLCSFGFNIILLNQDPIIEEKIIYEDRIIEIENIIEIEKEPIIKLTSKERELLARLLYREGRGESFECQCMIVGVVLNRSIRRNKSITDVIYEPGEFTTVNSLKNTIPNEMQYQVIDYVCYNGNPLPGYVLYFSGGGWHGWNGYLRYKNVDNTYFGYFQKDYNWWIKNYN